MIYVKSAGVSLELLHDISPRFVNHAEPIKVQQLLDLILDSNRIENRLQISVVFLHFEPDLESLLCIDHFFFP